MDYPATHISSDFHSPLGQKDLLGSTEFNYPEFAGFWLRLAATIIDAVIVIVGAIVVLIPIFMINENAVTVATYFMYPAYLLYYPIMESSKLQATWGKKVLGIIVTDENYQPITFLKALGRNAGKIISSLILYAGYIMALGTEKKQALHDIMASTLVVRK